MKYKLLSVENIAKTNIGDYFQALASSQFLPQVDGFIDREKLKDYDGEECKVIFLNRSNPPKILALFGMIIQSVVLLLSLIMVSLIKVLQKYVQKYYVLKGNMAFCSL